MNRLVAFLIALMLMTIASLASFAQTDDVYYDPNKDGSYQNHSQQNDNNNNNPNNNSGYQDDKRDGYDNPAAKYDSVDKNGNTYITNNYYYDEDNSDYYYTTRARRYYTPNYGVNYFSYWFTPTFYFGYSSWNSYVGYGYNYYDPYYYHRPHHVVVYDPWYDPYWDWNWGWNSCSYYSFCSYPYYGYGYPYSGYGGYYGGYYNGYNQGYYNGYNDGYYNGYGDGYYGSAYNNPHYYYYGPRKHRDKEDDQANSKPAAGRGNELPAVNKQLNTTIKNNAIEIPREGIQKPVERGAVKQPTKVEPSMEKGNQGNLPDANKYSGKSEQPVFKPNNNTNSPEPGKWNSNTPNIQKTEPKLYEKHAEEERPTNRWNENSAPKQEPRGNYREPQHFNEAPERNNRELEHYNQPTERPSPQQREFEQRNEQPRMNVEPRGNQQQQERPRMEQRNEQHEQPKFNSAPSHQPQEKNFNNSAPTPRGGGNFKRF